MAQIRIAATGVAEFVGSTEAHRRRILRPYKKKKSGEAKGRGHYYRAALNAIRRYFGSNKDVGIIADALSALKLQKKTGVTKRKLAEINHNIRVLNGFLKHYA